MVGKNNKFLKENKNNQRFLRFSLRKLSVGVVSVAIAAGFYVGGSQSVLADTPSTVPVVNQQSASTSTDSSAVAGAADSTSAASAAEQQKTTTLNVAEAKPAAASNTANLLDNKMQSNAVSVAAATVNDDDLLKNIKISNPTDPKFVQYQDLVDRYNSYMSYYYGEEKPSQYVFSVISDSRIDNDFIWTVDQDTGEKVSVYFNNWDRGITGYHQFINTDFDDNHNDYRYSKDGVTLSYDKPEGSSGSISVVDYNHYIWDLGNANLQDVYEINGSTDNSRYDSFATTLPEKGQPIIKFLYRNPNTGKLMNLRDPIYYSNGLTGQKFELDIGDSYKQELKDMFAGFKLVGSSKASGTFTQFAQGKTYIEHDASDDSEVIYQQIDAEGTMKVFYREKDGEKQPVLDTHGNPCQLKAGSSVKIGSKMVYNPFVAGDHAYELIYEPEDQSANIVYVDKDGNKIKTDTVNGKTTQTVDVKSNVPAGWVLVKGQHGAPATITFTGAHTDNITIKIEHGKTSVDHNHPVTPGDKTPSGKEIKGAHESDLNQTITRTINITEPGQATKTTTQVAHIYRDATVDDVTGEVTYSAWSTDSADWTAVNVPSHAGYTAHQSDGQTGIPVVTVKDGQKDVNIDVTYTPDEQKGQITYVDEKGNQISSTPLTGKTDQDVDVKGKINVPTNWKIVPGQTIPDTVKATADGIPTVTVKVQPKMDSITDPAKLNKSISRTITINKPGEKPQVINQHADFTRTGQYNEVTGTTIYTDWALKDSTLEAVDAPAVPGYTPNVAHVDGVKNPTADTKLNDVVINYTADDQNQVVNYVDQNGKVVKSDTITGKTDQTVDVNVKVPDHYELVNGQNIPENVTLKTNNPVINIQVTPKMDDITAPSQLTKAISRTITINVPHQTPIVENQSANFTRTGQHNEVTGEDVYTGWTLKDNSLRHVDVPAVPGYTPSQNTVDGIATPAVDTPVSDITVNYKANEQTGQITYVDEKGNQISSTPLTGKTDEDIAINPVAPAGWELVPGQKYPATVTATADGIPGVTLTVRHHMIKVVPGDVPTPGDKKPGNNDKKPGDGTPNKDITHEDLNKTITRTFIVKAPTGTMTKTQHISYQRTATIDDVTGDVTFSDWNTDGASFKAEVIPAISGYTSHVTEGNYGAYAPSQDQINNWTDPMITVTYTANDQSQVINYVDDHNKTIKTDTVHGKTDETVNVTPSVPDHYELVPGQNIPSEVTLKDKNTPIIVKVQPKVDSITDPAKLNKSISRTITINKPGEKPQVINQHADFTRTGQYNEVTGATVYTDWTLKGNTLEAVDAPAVPGYTPNVAHVDSVENPTADTKLANVVINYSADDQTQKIDYVDPNGKVVKTDTVKGKTDETVKVTPNVPDHYELVPGQEIPGEVKITDDNPAITVKVTPKLDPVTDSAKLNKNISRTITINKPGEKPQVINQTATFKRTGKTNEVTGITTYTPWVLDQNGLTTVSAPEVPGYTPSQKTVASVDNPTANTKLTDVTINYTANSQTTHINYVDKDGETVKSDTVSGKTDETVKTNSEVPAGWKITDGQIPETIHFTGEETPDTTITIEHDTTSVDHIKPVKPGDKTPSGKVIDGAHESDLNQTITRTINVTTPDGQTTTTKQVAKIFRDATIDDVTGEVTYGSWSEDTWADFKPGQVAGYTASPADVPAVTVKDGQKDQTVDITYTANEGTVLIKYVDRDGNEIGRQVITGHVGDTIKVTPQFPENWVPVDPDTVPAEVQIKEENGQIIIVVVRHAEKDPVQTKKVTRTITVTTPDGQTKTIKQVVTISRHGDLDLVTGQIAWQPWTTAQWDVFKPAAIAGYTPSLAEVPAVTVDGETTDQTVDITYAAVATPAQPGHQAPTASDTTDAQQVTNQKADSNAQPAVTVVTSQQTATVQQAESTTNSRRLPQTGNSHDASALAGLGLASLMGLFGLGGKRRKRD